MISITLHDHYSHDSDFLLYLSSPTFDLLVLGVNNVFLCAEVVDVYAATPLSRKAGTFTKTRLDQKCWILVHEIPSR